MFAIRTAIFVSSKFGHLFDAQIRRVSRTVTARRDNFGINIGTMVDFVPDHHAFVHAIDIVNLLIKHIHIHAVTIALPAIVHDVMTRAPGRWDLDTSGVMITRTGVLMRIFVRREQPWMFGIGVSNPFVVLEKVSSVFILVGGFAECVFEPVWI